MQTRTDGGQQVHVQEFREQIDDPDFEGFCHCMLYYKSREKKG